MSQEVNMLNKSMIYSLSNTMVWIDHMLGFGLGLGFLSHLSLEHFCSAVLVHVLQ